MSGNDYASERTLVDVVHDYASIRQAEKKGLLGHEKLFVNYIQALSNNENFTKEVFKTRKELLLPCDGLPFKQYLDFNQFLKANMPKKQAFVMSFMNECQRLRSEYVFHNNTSEHLYDIIFYGFVNPFNLEQSAISLRFSTPEPIEAIEIKIYEPMSKNAVLRYIDKNWKSIESGMKYITKKSTTDFHLISDRDFEIVTLRDEQKLTFAKIADKISKSSIEDDSDSAINEDSIKTAYKRAKKKISDIFKPKP